MTVAIPPYVRSIKVTIFITAKLLVLIGHLYDILVFKTNELPKTKIRISLFKMCKVKMMKNTHHIRGRILVTVYPLYLL
jgi:hypothetical protein